MEIRIKIKDKKGSMFPLTIGIIIVLLIIMTGISEYMRLKIIASGVQKAIQSSTITVSVENYENIYSSTRENNSASYKYNDDIKDWEEIIDTGDVYEELDSLLGLIVEEDKHIKRTENDLEYSLSNLDIMILNSPLISNNPEDKFIAETFINLEVPLSFGWGHLPPMNIRLKVRSEYMAKF